jgi:hypothetical protein
MHIVVLRQGYCGVSRANKHPFLNHLQKCVSMTLVQISSVALGMSCGACFVRLVRLFASYIAFPLRALSSKNSQDCDDL